MADPLSVLREFTMHNLKIIQRDGQIIFGNLSWPKHVETTCECRRSSIPSISDYYTLETLLFLVKNRSLSYSNYIIKARNMNIPVVKSEDCAVLIDYLSGKTNVCSLVDTNVPFMMPSYNKFPKDNRCEPSRQRFLYDKSHAQHKVQPAYKTWERSIPSTSFPDEGYQSKNNYVGNPRQCDVSRTNIRDNSRSGIDLYLPDDDYKIPQKRRRLEEENVQQKYVMPSDNVKDISDIMTTIDDSFINQETDISKHSIHSNVTGKWKKLNEGTHDSFIAEPPHLDGGMKTMKVVDPEIQETDISEYSLPGNVTGIPLRDDAKETTEMVDPVSVLRQFVKKWKWNTGIDWLGYLFFGRHYFQSLFKPILNVGILEPNCLRNNLGIGTESHVMCLLSNSARQRAYKLDEITQGVDPVSILREYHINGKDIIEHDDLIQLGPYTWPKEFKTKLECLRSNRNFRKPERLPRMELSLECLYFLLKNSSLYFDAYAQKAETLKMPYVRKCQHHPLLLYLTGKIEQPEYNRLVNYRNVQDLVRGTKVSSTTGIIYREEKKKEDCLITVPTITDFVKPVMKKKENESVSKEVTNVPILTRKTFTMVETNDHQTSLAAKEHASDPLSVLREYYLHKKPIVQSGGNIIFGNLVWPKRIKTGWKWRSMHEVISNVRQTNYTLECLVFLVRNIELSYSAYKRKSYKFRVRAVKDVDYHILINYFNGTVKDCISIDKSNESNIECLTELECTIIDDHSETNTPGNQPESATAGKCISEVTLAVPKDKENSQMIDPLRLLRDYHMNKKKIILQGSRMIFDHIGIPKQAETNCVSTQRRKVATYYSLECLDFFMRNWPALCKNGKLSYIAYEHLGQKHVKSYVHKPDAEIIYSYLIGDTDTCSLINPEKLFDQSQITHVSYNEIFEEPSSPSYVKKNTSQEPIIETGSEITVTKTDTHKNGSGEYQYTHLIDPFLLLRQYNIDKKVIIERDDQIIFDNISVSRNIAKRCVKNSFRKKQRNYFTLDTLVFFLKNASLPRREYEKKANTEKHEILSQYHEQCLRTYLSGITNHCQLFDSSISGKVPYQVVNTETAENLPKREPRNPFNMLREFCGSKQKLFRESGQVILGDYSWPEDTKTDYKIPGTQEFYTLGCLFFFYENYSGSHAEYKRKALAYNIPYVKEKDRTEVIVSLYSKDLESTSPEDLQANYAL